jgi:hypothetical protein
MKRIAAILTAIIAATSAYAGVGTTSMDILKVPSGLKAQAMGGAYIAVSDNLEALDINPAGLAAIERQDLMFIHNMYLQDVFFDSAYYAINLQGPGVIGFAGKFLSAGSIDETLETNAGTYAGMSGSKAGGTDFLAAAAYAQNAGKFAFNQFTKNLNIGADLKLSGQMLGKDYSNMGISADIGAIYNLVIEEEDFLSNRGQPIWNKASFGIVFQNLGTSFGSGITPITIALGTCMQFENIAASGNRIRVAADTGYDMDNGINLRAGLEYMQFIGNFDFAIRGGGNFNPAQRLASGFTLGGGMGLKINNVLYSLDYVFSPYNDLGSSQKFGLYIKF